MLLFFFAANIILLFRNSADFTQKSVYFIDKLMNTNVQTLFMPA